MTKYAGLQYIVDRPLEKRAFDPITLGVIGKGLLLGGKLAWKGLGLGAKVMGGVDAVTHGSKAVGSAARGDWAGAGRHGLQAGVGALWAGAGGKHRLGRLSNSRLGATARWGSMLMPESMAAQPSYVPPYAVPAAARNTMQQYRQNRPPRPLQPRQYHFPQHSTPGVRQSQW